MKRCTFYWKFKYSFIITNSMETLDSIKSDAREILLRMKSIDEAGPSEENAKAMIDEMYNLQGVVDRIDDIPDDE